MDVRMKWLYRLGFVLLVLILLYIFFQLKELWLPLLKLLLVVLIPFLLGAFFTYLLHPIVEKLHQTGMHRGLAALGIYLLFFGGVGYGSYKGIPAFIHQLNDLVDHAPEFAEQYRSFIALIQERTSEWPETLQLRVEDGINNIEAALDKLLTKAINILLEILNYALIIAIIPFISFYLLKDYTDVKKAVWYLTPRRWRKEAVLFIRDVDKSLGGYIRGQLLVCLVIGVISATLFWVFGMKYPLLLGFIIAITNIIPYFGPIIGAVPAVIIAATLSVKMVIITLIIIVVLQFVEGNILSPLIVGKSLHMHPLIIMLSLLAGGEAGGIIGLIMAVPILAILKISLIHARKLLMNRHRADKV
ncbi:AI-2E family transporter [Cytobacillus kochii]|uniref:AI-2E family transporter n=1 Tax=Cytobacillus kochii TaxID=859143 RepID=UPI002E1FA877|nr:AI-2E family transporter [Cytobacillus kochii]